MVISLTLIKQRARGMPGEGLTHGPRAEKNARGGHHRFSRTSGIPRAMGYGLYVVSPGTGFLAPVIHADRVKRVVANLILAPEYQDRTISPSVSYRSSA
jgi:hypothetical protein